MLSENINNKDNNEQMNLLAKLLEFLLSIFGLDGGEPLDDKFIENKNNRDMIQNSVKNVMNDDFKSSFIKFALNIPGINTMLKTHLDANPKLKEFAKKIVAAEPKLQEILKNNKDKEMFAEFLPKQSSQLRPLPDLKQNTQNIEKNSDDNNQDTPKCN